MEERTRGLELYVRHLSLFGRAVPLTIRAAIKNLVQKKGDTLNSILTDKKEHIRIFYDDLYKVLFEDSDDSIGERLESFGITTLCNIVFVLTEQPNIDYIRCILDQRRHLENYAKTHSLDYQTFHIKYTALEKSLLELIKNTDADYDCKRLIHSFDELKAIQISNEVYESLDLTGDVERHIEIVTECVLNLNAKNRIEEDSRHVNEVKKDVDELVRTEKFVQQLSDKILRTGESSVLVCELNKDNCHVVWSKNDEVLIETKTVYLMSEKGRHCLVFINAMPEESGTYKCTYKGLSTSASVIISKPDVMIHIPLHNKQNGDVREYMKVVLSCTINTPGKTPRWFHNNSEIEAFNTKVTVKSTDYEHKLIIDFVELDDNGEYMVVFDGVISKTSLTIKGHIKLTIKQQIKQSHYKNWMKAVLGLKYLKIGLQKPAKKAVKSHHVQIVKDLPKELSNEKCSECNAENLLPSHLKKQCPGNQSKHKCLCSKSSHTRRQCPSNGLCSEIYDLIVRDHRFANPSMRNIKMGLWKTDPWSVAACYMNSTEFIHASAYQYKKSSKELDCAELLSLFVNNKIYIQSTNYGVFDMAKRHRNDILHNPNYEISDDKLDEYLTDFQNVLEVKNYSNQRFFVNIPETHESLKALKELKDYDFDIYINEELDNMKKEVKDAAMIEAANTMEAAMKQKNEEFRRIQKKLNSDRHDTTENMCEKHDGTEISWYCIDHGKLICKSCMVNEHRTCSGLVKFKNRYTEVKQLSIEYVESHPLRGACITVCLLPHGEFLALIREESDTVEHIYELCKLNIDNSRTPDYVIINKCLNDICYIGNNKVVGTNESTLVFIDVSCLQILHIEKIKDVEGRHEYYVACYGDVIYACNGRVVLTCSTDGAHISSLCILPGIRQFTSSYCKITVSNDGESIYCIHGDLDMSKINSRNGVILFTFDLRRLNFRQPKSLRKHNLALPLSLQRFFNLAVDQVNLGQPLCMCYIGGGQVIICDDRGHVVKVDDRDEYVVSIISSLKTKHLSVVSMCYDTATSSLLVGNEKGYYIFKVLKS